MSLHQLAQQIQASGRGNDTQLVHMAPAEVRAMRKLAQQHGGDLSINPRTGLPEAGFLESILPTVVGAGVGIMTGNPMIGAAAGGAMGMAMNKGSIQSGLMAGLGAYGMGSLGAGLMETGASTVLGNAVEAGAGPMLSAEQLAANADAGLNSVAGPGATAGQTTAQAAKAFDAANPVAEASNWDKLQAGYKGTKFDMDFLKKNMFPIGMAAAPLLLNASSLSGQNQQAEANKGMIRPYTFSQTQNPRYGEPGQAQLIQQYTAQEPVAASDWGSRTMMANGGLASIRMAEGGETTDPRFTEPGITDADRYRYLAAQTAPPPAFASMPLAPQAQQPSYPAYAPPPTIQPTQAPIQQHYAAPTRDVNPSVVQYNQMIMDRATNEYVNGMYNPANTRPGVGYNSVDYSKLVNPVTGVKPGTAAGAAAKPGGGTSPGSTTTGGSTGGGGNTSSGNQTNTSPTSPTAPTSPTSSTSSTSSGNQTNTSPTSPTSSTSSGNQTNTAPTSPTSSTSSGNQTNTAPTSTAPSSTGDISDDDSSVAQAFPVPDPTPIDMYDPIDPMDPTVESPVTEAPVTEAPVTEAPVTEAPVTEAPVTEAPTEAPTEDDDGEDGDDGDDGDGDGGDGGGDGGGEKRGGLINRHYALGGNIHDLMQRYAMGGGIGNYYASPDDGNRNFGGIGALNQGPQYPMQGIGYAMGGQLGGYSDGGQLLRGPGDGVSDDIPAQIGQRQPARLADGEFVIPARIVSELGNGSTDAGAKRLYAMMDRIQANRSKTVGKGKVAVDSKARKHLPA